MGSYLEGGDGKNSKGENRGAIQEQNETIRLNQNNFAAQKNRESIKDYINDYKGAIQDYSEAIRMKLDYAQAYYTRGNSKYQLRDYKGAIEDYTEAIRLKSDYDDAYYNRAVSKTQLQDHHGAIEDYSEAVRLNPDYVSAYNNRGVCKNSLKDYLGAIQDYTEAIRLKPDHAISYNGRANNKRLVQDYKGAIQDYNQAIRLKPDYATACNNRGLSKQALQDYIGAIEDFTEAIRLKADYADAYQNRGSSRYLLQYYKEAIDDYTEAIRLKPDYAPAYNNRGVSHYHIQNHKEAIEDYNEAVRLKPDYAEAYNNRGLCKDSLQDYKGAQQDFLAALKLCRQQSPLVIFNLANLYIDMGLDGEALKRYTQGVDCFKKETESSLKAKFNLLDGNIDHIKSSIQNYEKLMKQVEQIKQQAQKLNKADILQELIQMNGAILRASIKSVDQKANQIQPWNRQKALEEQLKQIRKKFHDLEKRVGAVQNEVDKLKENVEQMGKHIYTEKKILEMIEQIDSRKLSEFYKILYNILINHFMAYRMLSTGFFKESVREVTTLEQVAGKVCEGQSIIESIKFLGALVGIPFRIIGILIEEKSSRLNSVISDKINGSKLQSQARITSYMSYLIEVLINNKAFNTKLIKSFQEEQGSFLNKAMDAFGTLKENIYATVFGGSSGGYTYVQQVVTLYMARFTLQLYEVEKDKFQQHCKSEEAFSEFFMEIFKDFLQNQPEFINDSVKVTTNDSPQAGSKGYFNCSLDTSAQIDSQPTYWQRFFKWL